MAQLDHVASCTRKSCSPRVACRSASHAKEVCAPRPAPKKRCLGPMPKVAIHFDTSSTSIASTHCLATSRSQPQKDRSLAAQRAANRGFRARRRGAAGRRRRGRPAGARGLLAGYQTCWLHVCASSGTAFVPRFVFQLCISFVRKRKRAASLYGQLCRGWVEMPFWRGRDIGTLILAVSNGDLTNLSATPAFESAPRDLQNTQFVLHVHIMAVLWWS